MCIFILGTGGDPSNSWCGSGRQCSGRGPSHIPLRPPVASQASSRPASAELILVFFLRDTFPQQLSVFSAGHLPLLVTLDVRLWLLGQIVKRECGSEDWGLMTFCIRDPIHLKCGDCRGIEEGEVISVRPRRGADDGSVDLTRPPNAIEMRAPSL